MTSVATRFTQDRRHQCQVVPHAGLHSYGWVRHDGTSFGRQEIIDDGTNISTTLVRHKRIPASRSKLGSCMSTATLDTHVGSHMAPR